MSSNDGFSLLLEFDRNEPQFSFGFEIGRLWAIISETEEEYETEVHTANAEMILRLAEAAERTVRTAEVGNGWMTAYFSERLV